MTPDNDYGTTRVPSHDAVTVTRSEERLDVHTVRTPTEKIRIRKVIVTEERTLTLTLRREEIIVDRAPSTVTRQRR